jgi:predicted nucleic acid-binding protein
MEHYLIDTNIISSYFSASLPESGLLFMDTIIDAVPNLSIISQIELLCWKTDETKEQRVKEFIADSTVFDISPAIVTHCVDIRRNKKIKTPDAIIAATSLAYGLTLVTNNEKDFNNIRDLKIVNPFKV